MSTKIARCHCRKGNKIHMNAFEGNEVIKGDKTKMEKRTETVAYKQDLVKNNHFI